MPSRDLVVQNQILRRQLEEALQVAEPLRRHCEHLENELRFARNWRGLGIGEKPSHFYRVGDTGIPMSPEHFKLLDEHVSRMTHAAYRVGREEALRRDELTHFENAALAAALSSKHSVWSQFHEAD